MNIYADFFSFLPVVGWFVSNSDVFGLRNINMRDPACTAVVLKRHTLSAMCSLLSIIAMSKHFVHERTKFENVMQLVWLFQMQQVLIR